MSGIMRIRFESDMPVSTVEVLTPDRQSIQRIAMRPGMERNVEVPTENSYLRIHLQSGKSLTIPRRADLDYVVTADDLERATGYKSRRSRIADPTSAPIKTVSGVRMYQVQRSAARFEDPGWIDSMYSAAPSPPETTSGLKVTWSPEVTPRRSEQLDELAFSPPQIEKPYTLHLEVEGAVLIATIPGSLASTYVRADDLGDSGTLVTVRVACLSDFANAVGNYMAHGDYYAAETMAEWADQAEQNLQSKVRDPFAAAVGAYLLLRLERYDSMRTWAKNLADWFPDISDGCVIWALQALQQLDDDAQAREYLLKAAERGWPVYMEGTRLLAANLRRLGDEGLAALRELEQGNGAVVSNSPFTARVKGRSQRGEGPISFDIGYESIS